MTTATTNTLSALFSALLSVTVVMSGAHVKELAGLTTDHASADMQQGHTKIATDLHNHIDKTSIKQLVKTGGDVVQADSRSLRLLQQNRRQLPMAELSLRAQSALLRLGSLLRMV